MTLRFRLKKTLLKIWYGDFFGTLEFAAYKGWLPARLNNTERYTLGQKPYVFGESYERIRWN